MIRIGIICPSEIAFRRFLPSLKKIENNQFIGVAVANNNEWVGLTEKILDSEKEKANNFVNQFGGKIFHSYQEFIESDEIDSVYLPLPPALHYKWAKKALLAGKHVLIEKPATTSYQETSELLEIARDKNLAIHENYMFAFHSQLTEISDILNNDAIGDIHLFRISFGFPRRASNDFRYNKKLGGGALLDAGGYTLKYARMLLGNTAKLVYAQSSYLDEFEVDIFGSAALVNDSGSTVQIAFGMDNSYKCDLEVWGSIGTLFSGRVLTAPAGFEPEVVIKMQNESKIIKLNSDDAFQKSIIHFNKCIREDKIRLKNYDDLLKQAELVEDFKTKASL
jgi:NDP-hexose-3-ketoreductase